jgi:hypothetical protein
MTDAPRSRSRAVTTFVVLVVGLGALFAACTTYERDNGYACLKDSDCNSGYCVAALCAGAPPLLPPGASYPSDAASDTGGGSEDAGSDSGPPPSDSGSDGDGPAVVVNDSGPDAADANENDASDGSIPESSVTDGANDGALDSATD